FRKNRSIRAGLVGLAASALVLSACSSTDPDSASEDGGATLERLQDAGSVKVGFANERPYAFRDDGELQGEAPAIHGHIFEQLGVETLEPNLFDFGSLIQALNSERVDVVSAG